MISSRASLTDESSDAPRKSQRVHSSFYSFDIPPYDIETDTTEICVNLESRSSTEATTTSTELMTTAILFVDDTLVNCNMLLKIFGFANAHKQSIASTHASGAGKLPDTGNGIQLHLANDGLTALNYVNKNDLAVDYVITDYNMCKMNGDELVKLLHKGNRCHKEFILLTAADTDEIESIKKDFRDEGINKFSIFQRSEFSLITKKARAIVAEASKNSAAVK